MLRQDRIFDRPEEGRMHAHREQGEQQQRDRSAVHAMPCQAISEAGAADQHDDDLGRFTMRMIFALSLASASWPASAESRKKGRMKTAVVIALNQNSSRSLVVDLVDDEQHHRVLEQIVVERAEQLGDEQRQEAPRAEQVGGAGHANPEATRNRRRPPAKAQQGNPHVTPACRAVASS